MCSTPPTSADADYIARVLMTHLVNTLIQALAEHPTAEGGKAGLDAVDFSRFLHGEVRQNVAAIEQRIASLLPPLRAADVELAADPVLRAAAGRRSVRAYLRRAAREGEFIRTKDGLRRVVE